MQRAGGHDCGKSEAERRRRSWAKRDTAARRAAGEKKRQRAGGSLANQANASGEGSGRSARERAGRRGGVARRQLPSEERGTRAANPAQAVQRAMSWRPAWRRRRGQRGTAADAEVRMEESDRDNVGSPLRCGGGGGAGSAEVEKNGRKFGGGWKAATQRCSRNKRQPEEGQRCDVGGEAVASVGVCGEHEWRSGNLDTNKRPLRPARGERRKRRRQRNEGRGTVTSPAATCAWYGRPGKEEAMAGRVIDPGGSG